MVMPGHAGIEALIRHLAPNWEIASTLSAKIMGEQRQILEATKINTKSYRFLVDCQEPSFEGVPDLERPLP